MSDIDEAAVEAQDVDLQEPKVDAPGRKEMEGAFFESLRRTNRQIRADRAQAISRNAELIFKRAVEDIAAEIETLELDREGMLDMSPEHGMSLKVASDFDAQEFVRKDLDLGLKIRNAKIKLDIAQRRFRYLFGKEAM